MNWGYIIVFVAFVTALGAVWGAAIPAAAVALGLVWLGMTLNGYAEARGR